MKVKEFIAELQKLDPEKNIWQIYDPPYACWEPEVVHCVDSDAMYAEMFDEVQEGDYAIVSG